MVLTGRLAEKLVRGSGCDFSLSGSRNNFPCRGLDSVPVVAVFYHFTDCPDMLIAPLSFEYMHPSGVWKTLSVWIPDRVYSGYLYSSVNILYGCGVDYRASYLDIVLPFSILPADSSALPEQGEFELVVRFSEWAHGGLDLLRSAHSAVQAALVSLGLGATWGSPSFSSPGGDMEVVEMRMPFVMPVGSAAGVLKVLKPLFKPVMKWVLALGCIITSWKIVDVVKQNESNAQEDQADELTRYLVDEGYTPDQIRVILAAIYGLKDRKGIVDTIVPVALIFGGAYILSQVVKK